MLSRSETLGWRKGKVCSGTGGMRHRLEDLAGDKRNWMLDLAWIVDVVWMVITSLEAFYLTGPAGYVVGGL